MTKNSHGVKSDASTPSVEQSTSPTVSVIVSEIRELLRKVAHLPETEQTLARCSLAEAFREAGADLCDSEIPAAHGNSRPVAISGPIDKATYHARPSAKEITSGYFASAMAASNHFGYEWNAVSQALLRASKRGQQVAVVNGVPVEWADQNPGLK